MTKGIDVSKWQDGLDIGKVRKAGFEFAILRGGYTSTGDGKTRNKDPLFEAFYKDAKRNGFPVGVYYYSCANTKRAGAADARFLFDNCLKGRTFEYPVYIDVEEERYQRNKKEATDAIIGFCDELKTLGYMGGVYASRNWFETRIDNTRIESVTKWVASWTAKKPQMNLKGFDLWQNSDSGKVGSITVDTNVSFRNFPAHIKKHGLNGYKTIEALAKEVIKGKWGNGAERKAALEKAGYDYAKVQSKVNELMR